MFKGDGKRDWPKRLFIFDLNGVLVLRSKKRVRSISPNLKDPAGRFAYLRPNVKGLLHWLNRQRNVAIGIWSSAKPDIVNMYIKSMFQRNDNSSVIFDVILNQDDCSPDKGVLRKPLEVLWGKNLKWNPRNTVLFDDTVAKCKQNPTNCVIIPTYDPAVVDCDYFAVNGDGWRYLDRLTR